MSDTFSNTIYNEKSSEIRTKKMGDYLFPKSLRVTKDNINKILMIGSCNIELFFRHLPQINPSIRLDYILINNASQMPDRPPSAVEDYDLAIVQLPLRTLIDDSIFNYREVMLFDGPRVGLYERARQMLGVMLDAALSYNVQRGLLTIICNFQMPQRSASVSLDTVGTDVDICKLIRILNEDLVLHISRKKNAYILDLDQLSASAGRMFFNDDHINFFTHSAAWDIELHRSFDVIPNHKRIEDLPDLSSLYENDLNYVFSLMWEQIVAIYRTVKQIDSVKLVIFDLDDTIWRGQIAEHYDDSAERPVQYGWPIGLWESIQHLRARGIMVAICSKNDPEIVEARWDRGVISAWLNFNHFTFKKINWKPKTENIQEIIAKALVTPKSVLFIDDNPIERESVKTAFPDIRVLGSDSHSLRRILLWSSETQVATLSRESLNRDAMIRATAERDNLRTEMSREEFLAQLQCCIEIKQLSGISSPDFSRIFELINKTNQYNTTGQRWSSAQLDEFYADYGSVYYFKANDRYIDHGIVGVIFVCRNHIRQFIMSCRVIGLEIEIGVLSSLVNNQKKYKTITAEIKHTGSNGVCQDLFLKSGFTINDKDSSQFELQLENAKDVPHHLRIYLDI